MSNSLTHLFPHLRPSTSPVGVSECWKFDIYPPFLHRTLNGTEVGASPLLLKNVGISKVELNYCSRVHIASRFRWITHANKGYVGPFNGKEVDSAILGVRGMMH